MVAVNRSKRNRLESAVIDTIIAEHVSSETMTGLDSADGAEIVS